MYVCMYVHTYKPSLKLRARKLTFFTDQGICFEASMLQWNHFR